MHSTSRSNLSFFHKKDAERFVSMVRAAITGEFELFTPEHFKSYQNQYGTTYFSDEGDERVCLRTVEFDKILVASCGMKYQELSTETPETSLHALNLVAKYNDFPKRCATGARWWDHPNGYSHELIKRFGQAGFRIAGGFADWSLTNLTFDPVELNHTGGDQDLAAINDEIARGKFRQASETAHLHLRNLVSRHGHEINGNGYRDFAFGLAEKHGQLCQHRQKKYMTSACFEALMHMIQDVRNSSSKRLEPDAFVNEEYGRSASLSSLAALHVIYATVKAEVPVQDDDFGIVP